jgi:hypothetical protein
MVRTSYWTKVTDYFNTIKKKISRRSHFELNEKQDKNFGFQVIGTEEPYERNLHVRICGGSGWVTGCFYPEIDRRGCAYN